MHTPPAHASLPTRASATSNGRTHATQLRATQLRATRLRATRLRAPGFLAFALFTAALAACGTSDDATQVHVEFLEPSQGATLSGVTDILIEASASRGNFELVLLPPAAFVGQDQGRFSFRWDPGSAAGPQTLTATATADDGTVASHQITVNVHATYAPTLMRCDERAESCARFDGTPLSGLVNFVVNLPQHHRGVRAEVSWAVDDAPLAGAATYPFAAALNTMDLDDGEHTLRMEFSPEFGEPVIITRTFEVVNCDFDGDGYLRISCGGDDCDDTDPNISPGAVDICDGISNDCDDEIDEDAECGEGTYCAAGACVSSVCEAIGAPCNTEEAGVWPFVCDLQAGVCEQRCPLDHPRPLQACPRLHTCRAPDALALGEDVGLCVPSACSSDAQCAGHPDGPVCVRYDAGFSACGQAGRGAIGDSCAPPSRYDQPLVRPCGEGLECFAGRCTATCKVADDECAEGTGCIELWPAADTGICLTACGDFSGTGCAAGTQCQPVADFASTQSTGWACVEAATPAPIGERCVPGESVCVSGAHCVDITGSKGVDFRCARACQDRGQCGEGQRCSPTRGSLRSTCVTECAPFSDPSDEACADSADTCHPTSGGGGACVGAAGTTPIGEACSPARGFGTCAEGGYCVALGDEAPRCRALCDVFGLAPACPEGAVCHAQPLLDGHGGFGVCDDAPASGALGDACSAVGHACSEPGTLCVDAGEGARCRAVCAGPEDCGGERCEWTLPLEGILRRAPSGVCAL